MGGYEPLKITGMKTGLVQNREEMILPADAYPTLQNAYVWRERILRKKGTLFLGRLQRNIAAAGGNTNGAGVFQKTLRTFLSWETNATLAPGLFTATIGANTYTEPDPPDGTILKNGFLEASSFINWATTEVKLAGAAPATATAITNASYYPNLPVMGILNRSTISGDDEMVAFDQKYAYVFDGSAQAFKEFISGTTWNASGGPSTSVDFFWGTNWWNSSNPPFTTSDLPLFWVTNDTGNQGATADPIRVTDGTTWLNFSPPTYGKTNNSAGTYVFSCLAMTPFRGRLLMFNTWEGTGFASGVNYYNRIRWSQIGNPFQSDAWYDDIGGKGGYLDIPTTEDITSIGVVRDNLVIYCENSTWQLRYTGRSIAPFQIEKVNTELGAFSAFSAIQFDTSLVGIGDKGVIECDSYKSNRIDVKIPDLVYKFSTDNNGKYRIHGVRDFVNRLAFWTYADSNSSAIFPNRRLSYNYENDSWAIFDDDFTVLGTYYPTYNRVWVNIRQAWIHIPDPWITSLASNPEIVGGNQQGFVSYLDKLDNNDPTLSIKSITPNTTTATTITSLYHNLETGDVISISGIPDGTAYSSLNGGVYSVVVSDSDNFDLYTYDASTGQFSTPRLDTTAATSYVGGGVISIRDPLSITSKKFNFIEEGRSIQMGYIDILMAATSQDNPGAISLNVYLDYNDDVASNILPNNVINNVDSPNPVTSPDTFFNSVIPTTSSTLNLKGGTKFWQRVYCPTRANFLTLEYTFSNAQMAGIECTLPVQIDAQVLWVRKAGNMTQV